LKFDNEAPRIHCRDGHVNGGGATV